MYSLELQADQFETAQAAQQDLNGQATLEPIAARIRAEGNDYGKTVRIFVRSGYGDVQRSSAHLLRVTADARLFVDGQDMTADAPYWLEQLVRASVKTVILPAGRYAPLVEVQQPVTLTNPAYPQGFRVNLTWLRSDPTRVQGRRNSRRAA